MLSPNTPEQGRDRFAVCLALTLREEEGQTQPVGGPYLRGRWAYSDDPDDSGGKTMMGILQREYDAWRRNQGQPLQWVKYITDDELTAIYHAQFWLPVRARELPMGVDLAVWDMGVNCGVGTAIKKLQLALGLKADGHLGQITIDAANRADPAVLIHKISDLRRAYHRACRTFWKHGKNWLERTARIEGRAVASVGMAPVALPASNYQDHTEDNTINARADAPPPTPPAAAEATVALASTGGIANEIAGAFGRMQDISIRGFVIALLSSPTFWASVFALGGAVYFYLYRRRHQEVAP